MEFLRSFLRRHLAGKPVTWQGHQMSAVFSGCTRFQVKEILSLLLTLERQQKRFLKPISNSHISLSFLFIWKGNDKYVHACVHSLQFPWKPYPNPDQNGKSLNPFSDRSRLIGFCFRPKRRITIPFRAAHTYMAYLREYLLGFSFPWKKFVGREER